MLGCALGSGVGIVGGACVFGHDRFGRAVAPSARCVSSLGLCACKSLVSVFVREFGDFKNFYRASRVVAGNSLVDVLITGVIVV